MKTIVKQKELPKETKVISQIIRKAADKFTSNIDDAAEAALSAIIKLPASKEYIRNAVKVAIKSEIYAHRNQIKECIASDRGKYCTTRKVGIDMRLANMQYLAYSFPVMGKQMGDLVYSECVAWRDLEANQAAGHHKRENLAIKLIQSKLPKDDSKPVRQIIKESTLKQMIMDELGNDPILTYD